MTMHGLDATAVLIMFIKVNIFYALKKGDIIPGVNIFEIDLANAREEFHKLGRPGKNLCNFGTITKQERAL